MSIEPIHRVERVPPRTVWPHEQKEFSQWLVQNIDLLNEQLPFEVDPDSLSPEQRAGDFWVDVVGEAADPESAEPIKVVIENQLEPTNHDHLGKVLTYAAAFDARAAIWISARARPEHAKAIQWLNDESSIDAWLFDVEVVRIGDSPVAPLLTQIVGPSRLSKEAKAEKQASNADRKAKEAFWTLVLLKVADACSHLGVWQGRAPSSSVHVWQTVPNGVGNMGWQVWVTMQTSWICLRVDAETQEEATAYFEQLLEQKEAIEADFDGPLQWSPLDGYRASLLRWDNPIPGGFRDDPETWPEVADAIAQAMASLVEATRTRVAALEPYALEPSPTNSESVVISPTETQTEAHLDRETI